MLSKFVTKENLWTLVKNIYYVHLALFVIVFATNSFNWYVVIINIVLTQLIHAMAFLLNSSKVNSFGEIKLAGLCITTLASLMNFGNNSWIQLKVIQIVGYYPSLTFGLLLSILMGIFSDPIFKWIENGLSESEFQRL